MTVYLDMLVPLIQLVVSYGHKLRSYIDMPIRILVDAFGILHQIYDMILSIGKMIV